jgi:rSAM/selenodomain-associated transferase 2
MTALAVVIPTRQEASRLPLLLADLRAAPPGLISELVVVDGGSGDATATAAALAGAQVLHTAPSRGGQLRAGVAATTAPWLLLLHGDARLPQGWPCAVGAALAAPQGDGGCAWCFDLAVAGPGLPLRLLELAVFWRTRLRRLPYGDQGLLLPRALLERCGGIAPLPLMEDLELMLRLRRHARIHGLGLPLLVDGRRWRRLGVLGTAWRNAALRQAWRRGCDPAELAKRYAAAGSAPQGEYQKAQRRFWGSSSQPWAP